MSEVAATISPRAPVRLEEITDANVTPATEPAGRTISAVEADHDRARTEPPARADLAPRDPTIDTSAVVADLEALALDRLDQVQVLRFGG